MEKPYTLKYRIYIRVKYGFYRFLYFLRGRPFPVKKKKRWTEITMDYTNLKGVTVGAVVKSMETE